MRSVIRLAGAAVLHVTSIATAQEFNVPTFYMSFPPSISTPAAPAGGTVAPTLTNVVHIWTPENGANPVTVADLAVADILSRLYPTVGAPTLQADKICLNLIWLGHTLTRKWLDIRRSWVTLG